MIVAPIFDGDDDFAAMNMQHDCYSDALHVLVGQCQRLTLFARALLNDQAFPGWGTVDTFDHRCLQQAHDLLAAVWRFRTRNSQASLPFDGHDPWPAPLKDDWLEWLAQEISSWIDDPELVRTVQIILANQNTDRGYKAEETLAAALVDRFSDVPWYSRRKGEAG